MQNTLIPASAGISTAEGPGKMTYYSPTRDDSQQVFEVDVSTASTGNPMERFPVEIISMIFDEYVHHTDDDHRWYEPQTTLTVAIFKLGSVCRSWRGVIWGTPQFWKSLPVVIHNRNLARAPTIIQGWLERGCNSPLSATLRVYQESHHLTESGMDNFLRVANLINASSSRLERLVLDMPFALLSKFAARAPSLKEICIDNSDVNCEWLKPRERWINFPESLGLAKFVETKCKPAPFRALIKFAALKSIHASWYNLVCVSIRDLDIGDIFTILQEAPKLQELDIIERRASPYVMKAPATLIVHSALARLGIQALDETFVDIVLRNISSLPALKSLIIEMDWQGVVIWSITSLIERSSCQLDQFAIGARFDDETQLISMLRTMLYLTYLHLSASYVSGPDLTIENIIKQISATVELERQFHDTSLQSERTHVEETFLPALKLMTYIPTGNQEAERIWALQRNISGNIKLNVLIMLLVQNVARLLTQNVAASPTRWKGFSTGRIIL